MEAPKPGSSLVPPVTIPSASEVKEAVSQKTSEVGRKISAKTSGRNLFLVVGVVLVILAGVGTGWILSGKSGGSSSKVAPGAKQTAKEAGISDEATFKDSAEGTLEDGGIAGEGTHHLVRDGGASQYVYLTSTAIDLSSFTGKKVKVWGQTISARKAGWLMDVGKIKVIE